MKTKISFFCLMAVSLSTIFYSCKKSIDTNTTDENTASTSAAILSSGAISISSLTSSISTGKKDSLYLIGCYSGKVKKDTAAQSNLLSAITTYLTTNYAGYTFKKAFKITDATNTVTGYVVLIKYNDKLIGLKFDATGTFVKVLEQREGVDLLGKGWHPGGRFDFRDGKHRDTIALSAIPTAVKNFFTATYPTDTLLHAQLTPDTNYVLISKNNGLFATGITPGGTLLKRITIDNSKNKHIAILEANLLPSITSYLTTTYPGYVFAKAFAEQKANVVQSYVVIITANNTKYALKFNATGTFVALIVIR